MLGIGMPEILVILVVALIVIGPKRLPEVARTLGKGFAEFKKATDDFQESVRKDLEQEKRQDLLKHHPQFSEENVEDGKGMEGAGTPPGDTLSTREPEPSYSPDEIEGGEEGEKETPDGR
jgi:Tat protein translocase TatB subunit